MPDTATLTKQTGAPTRLGSFDVGTRLNDKRSASEPVATLEVTGALDTPFAGQHAHATCYVIPASAADRIREIEPALQRLRSVRSDQLVPVLETGYTGSVVYFIEATPAGERLSDRLRRDGRMTPRAVVAVLTGVSSALGEAARQGVRLGTITAFSLWIDDRDKIVIGGYGLVSRTPDAELRHLGLLAMELLAGHPLEPVPAAITADRVRGHVNGLTERTANAIARCFATPGSGYASPGEFVRAFTQSNTDSAVDLVAGAWEAISRNDTPMAELLVEMVDGYDPGTPDLPVLKVKLGQHMGSDPAAAAARLIDSALSHRLAQAAVAAAPTSEPSMSEPQIELTPELRALLAGPPIEAPKKSRLNYWAIFAAGVCGMVIILVVLVALTFSST